MKELKITSIITLALLLLNGCYYDVEEEIYPTIDCSVLDMSYLADILPILTSNCYTCHSAAANFGNITLEGHDQLLRYVDDSTLLGAIKHEAGFSPMPQNRAQILQCEIEKIEAWIQQGALNN
jgi:uncharacterized membrane protein